MQKLDESIKLRDYSKNLLNTLKLQQLNINKSVNEITVNEFNPIELNELISSINNFKTNINAASSSSMKIQTSVQKSVSFSETLIASPRRRAKSVPPKLGTNKKKKTSKKSVKKKLKLPRSILKRQLSFDTTDNTDTDSMDDETKNLFNEISDFYLKNNEYSINIKDINKNDKQSLIQCLTKTRQKYLNHVYNDSNDSNIDFEEYKKKVNFSFFYG